MSNKPTELFSSGNILFVKNYDFGNANPTRDKYLIVLHTSDNFTFLIHSLTTSQVKVPPNKVNHGCTNNEDLGLSFYMFESGREIGATNNHTFPNNTYIFFQSNIHKNPISHFDKHTNNNQIKLIDKLDNKEFKRLLKCAIKSFSIRRDMKVLLLEQLELLK